MDENMNEINEKKEGIFSHDIKEILSKNKFIFPKKHDKGERICDHFDRKEIEGRLSGFIAHCAAKKVNPSLNVILDFLYSNKNPNEPDDFVRIDRLIEMLKEGQIYPELIAEVLMYASKMEKEACELVKFINMKAVEDELPECYNNLKETLKYALAD